MPPRWPRTRAPLVWVRALRRADLRARRGCSVLGAKQMSAIAISRSVRFEQLREPGHGIDAFVLASTFEPRGVPSCTIFRARLVDRLSRDMRNNQVTLLSAPAGAGKTVLAASWAASARVSYPVAWLTVDDVCDKPLAFWQCVIEALSLVGADLPRAQRGVADEPVPRSFFMNLAADILSLPGPVVLVLDLADRALGPEITAGLDFLLRHADPQFRLVVCGRADPDLPIHRYRLADSVAELEAGCARLHRCRSGGAAWPAST